MLFDGWSFGLVSLTSYILFLVWVLVLVAVFQNTEIFINCLHHHMEYFCSFDMDFSGCGFSLDWASFLLAVLLVTRPCLFFFGWKLLLFLQASLIIFQVGFHGSLIYFYHVSDDPFLMLFNDRWTGWSTNGCNALPLRHDSFASVCIIPS